MIKPLLTCLILFSFCLGHADGQLWQRRYYQPPQQQFQQNTWQQQQLLQRQRLQQQQLQQQQNQGLNVPPGGQTYRRSDGSVVIITPFTAEQKRQIREREARRKEIANVRRAEIESQPANDSIYPRLPGEFEKQKAILLSTSDWQPHHFPVLKEIVDKTRGYAELVILFNEKNRYDENQQLGEILGLFADADQDMSHVKFFNLNLNTVWLRDFGPRIAEKADGGVMSIDFYYDPVRPKDDDFPESWANVVKAEYNHVPWTMQGGNLLANGKGMAVATSRIYEDNRLSRRNTSLEQDEAYVKEQITKFCNIKELVVLKPLENEATRHVDMFMTLLAPDLALVAQVDRRYDPQNAQILDQNAQTLAKVKVDGKPMRVERIQVPPRNGKYWSPYTNIIMTDKIVLMPTFDTDHPTYVSRALQTYRRLLPNHKVETINMTTMDKLEGSLHCLSCNVPEFATLPDNLLTFEEAKKLSGKSFVNTNTTKKNDTQPQLRRETRQPKQNTVYTDPKIEATKQAVLTYRRRCRLANDDQMEGYVIGVSDNEVTMLRVDTREVVRVRQTFLERQDRDWATQNRNQINAYGERVRQFVIDYDLN